MSGRNCLLDNNIVISLFANELSVTEKIKSYTGNILIPSIVLGELFYGAEQSTAGTLIKGKLKSLRKHQLFSNATPKQRVYERIKGRLKAKGTPIPENDIWIATLAEQHQLLLITRDKHFDNIDELSIEAW